MMAKDQTKNITEKSLWYQYMQNRQYPRGGTPYLHQQKVMILVRGITETFSVKPGSSLYIGRFQHDNQINIDLDLSPYGAARRGVSRVHARLDIDFFRHVFVSDLASTNGTFFVGQRIEPHLPVLIRDGDEIVLGNLPLRIFFD